MRTFEQIREEQMVEKAFVLDRMFNLQAFDTHAAARQLRREGYYENHTREECAKRIEEILKDMQK